MGVEATLATNEEACRSYIEVVRALNVGTALRWGFACTTLPLTSATLDDALTALRDLEKYLVTRTAMADDNELLLNSVRWRRFELDDLVEWRTRPSFYTWRLGIGLLKAVTRTGTGKFPEVHANQVVSRLPSVMRTARENLNPALVAKLDALASVSDLKEMTRWLQSVAWPTKNEVITNQALQAISCLKDDLQAIVESSRRLTLPVGAEMLTQWLRLSSGVNVDLSVLADLCVKTIRQASKHHLELASVASDLDLKTLALYIYGKCSDWFGSSPQVLDDLVFVFLDPSPNEKRLAGYGAKSYVGKETNALAVFPQEERFCTASTIMDLVHEVFPGHHLERTRFAETYRGRLSALTCESRVHLEGWASYSEFFWAENYGAQAEKLVWDRHKMILALRALAATRIHGGEDFYAVARDISVLGVLPLSRSISLCLDCYLHPLEAVSPMVGFEVILRRCQSVSDLKTLHHTLTEGGPRSLWGAQMV